MRTCNPAVKLLSNIIESNSQYLTISILLLSHKLSVACLGHNDFPITRGIQAVSENPLDGAMVEAVQVSEAEKGWGIGEELD